MKPLSSWMSGVWVLAFILGLTGASWATQVTTDHRPPTADRRSLTAGEPDAATKATIQAAYGKLPLYFEVNQGQSDKQVKFLSRGSGYTLFLTSTEAVLALHKPAPAGHGDAETRGYGDTETVAASTTADAATLGAALGPEPLALSPQPSALLLRMQLVGANPDPQVAGLDELPGKSNYFLGNDLKNWHTNVPTYARVQYKDIYPGIDLIYYGNQRQLEYDFVVSPGADPGVIKLAFDGLPPHPVPLVAQPSWLRAGWKPAPLGERGPMPNVFAPSPLAADKGRYHEPKDSKAGLHPLSDSPPSKGERKEVPSPLAGEGQDGGRSWLPLQIDDNGDLILHTEGGEIRLHQPRIYQEINGVKQPIPGGYVLLSPQSSSLVTFHVAAYDPTKPLIIDPTLSYSTYLGGSGDDNVSNMAVDSSGNAYVTGLTNSTNFPTASPLQATHGGGTWDIFVTKLNAAGSALVYSTYLGGSGNDYGDDITVDSSGNAYVTGITVSTNFPTVSPLQATFGGGTYDAFVTKLNAAGSALVYSTYLGGSGEESGSNNIAVDASGNAYVAGTTFSTNFPTVSPLQAANGGAQDTFVTKLNAAGSALVYSTYLGGSGTEEGASFAVDSSGSAYVTGATTSTNYPTVSPLQATFGGGTNDAFVTKLNAAGSALVYSTYLGGSGEESGADIDVDASGNAYVTGTTRSTNFPTVSPLQAANSGGTDVFVAKIAGEDGGPVCPATVALEGAPQEEAKLGVLYNFRDEVLANTPTGQRYIELFYDHAEEGVELMLSYPELLSHTYTLLEHFLPTIQAAVAGLEVTVTTADLADIGALLEAFAAQGSPELQADLRAIQEELWQGGLLEQFGIVVR